MTPDELVAYITAVINREGGRPGSSLHSWRCEYPLVYPQPGCTCVEQIAQEIADRLLDEGRLT